MPHCPACRTEFRDGIDTCSECGAPLQPGPLPVPQSDQPPAAEVWRVVLTVGRPEHAEIVRGLLESQEIPCEVIDRTLSEMPLAFTSRIAALDIMVPEGRAEEAATLLREPPEGTSLCPACGHLGSAEDQACEYCGAPKS